MDARSYRPQIIEALTALWRTLPLRGVTDEHGVMEDYCFALRNFSEEAVANTVNALREGGIEGASKSFCPTAPQLADYVRAEQGRIDIMSRPRLAPPAPGPRGPSPFEIRRDGLLHDNRDRPVLYEGITLDRFKAMGSELPVGSKWVGVLGGRIYGPAKGEAG